MIKFKPHNSSGERTLTMGYHPDWDAVKRFSVSLDGWDDFITGKTFNVNYHATNEKHSQISFGFGIGSLYKC